MQYLIGAVQASQNRDPDAIAAWELSASSGMAPGVVRPLLIEAYLRRGDADRAAALVPAEFTLRPTAGPWLRAQVAPHLAGGRDRDAIVVLDAHLSRTPDDGEARWLLLQALYGSIVRGAGGDRTRFTTAALAYIAAGGANAALVADWLAALGREGQ